MHEQVLLKLRYNFIRLENSHGRSRKSDAWITEFPLNTNEKFFFSESLFFFLLALYFLQFDVTRFCHLASSSITKRDGLGIVFGRETNESACRHRDGAGDPNQTYTALSRGWHETTITSY
jgi:hypothetical protein